MRNFWEKMNIRWSGEELSGWGSFQKTAYLLWPLLIYFVVHDAAEILLWAGVNGAVRANEGLALFLQADFATLRGVINGLAILIGVAVIRHAVREEIAGAAEESGASASKLRPGKERAGDKSPGGFPELVTRYFVLTAIAFLAALGLNILMNLLGVTAISKNYEDTAAAQYGVNFIIGLVLYGVLSPLAEEAVFRGLIYNRMKRCFNYPVALGVSALLFGCYHGNLVQAVYGTILGLLIAWCYEKSGSFSAPVLVHGVANVSMYVMTYYGGLGGMSRPVSIAVMAVSLLGAGGFLRYFKRRCLPGSHGD